ncbi:MAG: endonuclease III [Myxococcales bacterium]|nr:endonuclease III [Myxococcales bacterium]MCB9709431.1 endonuclease III [Myxococcales bacterium]
MTGEGGSPDAPAEKARRKAIHARLKFMLPHPRCELDFDSPWQLLVATILAAQSTDKGVNKVTPELFRRWPTPAKLARAPKPAVEVVIRPTGFYRNKAKAICGAARVVTEKYGGEVPKDMAALCTLPGVARKTANVVLGTAFGINAGMAIDTHASRVAKRLALTQKDDPVKIEMELCSQFPKRVWTALGHRLVLHGRYVCLARRPKCAECPINELCPSALSAPELAWRTRARAAEKTMLEQHRPTRPTH